LIKLQNVTGDGQGENAPGICSLEDDSIHV
jgi:hypothetical protein